MGRMGSLDLRAPALITGYAVSATVAVAASTLPIPVTHPIVLKTNAGAEANTLANGLAEGQCLSIILVATGGASTITPVTSTGCTTIVLTAVHDQVMLCWVDSTVGWIVVGAVGAANTPTVT